ncbi:hypothetical protein H8S90_19920 [Olivibacter sp. SDN3]|uniref:hypothetical protein n=1 Tax=Olivibacter sp. SDN3 TaxID=2764720 RepID=UPI0016517787|nr:hypothetical protein [Olivibacter sp. SDN3]QNL48995.1 hypothetical protein H8S90_19920 [Olivibacter sp. SDN3]
MKTPKKTDKKIGSKAPSHEADKSDIKSTQPKSKRGFDDDDDDFDFNELDTFDNFDDFDDDDDDY